MGIGDCMRIMAEARLDDGLLEDGGGVAACADGERVGPLPVPVGAFGDFVRNAVELGCAAGVSHEISEGADTTRGGGGWPSGLRCRAHPARSPCVR